MFIDTLHMRNSDCAFLKKKRKKKLWGKIIRESKVIKNVVALYLQQQHGRFLHNLAALQEVPALSMLFAQRVCTTPDKNSCVFAKKTPGSIWDCYNYLPLIKTLHIPNSQSGSVHLDAAQQEVSTDTYTFKIN